MTSRKGKLLSEGRQSRVRIQSSRKQEKRLATDIGGKTVSGSGSKWTAKGDARSDRYLVEAKETVNESYSLKLATWEKIQIEAFKDSREPIMQLKIVNTKLAVISWDHYLLLQELINGTP